jgi:ABC-type dipeptide/oligopeptide/nickel transport system permease subunit
VTSPSPSADSALAAHAPPPAGVRRLLRALLRDKVTLAALLVIAVLATLAALAPWLSPYDPAEVNFGSRYAPVGHPEHLLGTDKLGRDILSRLLWGGRISLAVGVLPVALAALVSFVLGMLAGYVGGWLDQAVMRIIDVWFAFPLLLLAMLLITILGPNLLSVVTAVALGMVPYITRMVRTATVAEKSRDYVTAAEISGASLRTMLFSELLPNVIPSVLAYCAMLIGVAIVVGAGLSFLGLGVQPPTADWGLMLADGQEVMREAPHVTIIPGLAILTAAVAFNLLSDGLRDLLDPRTQR